MMRLDDRTSQYSVGEIFELGFGSVSPTLNTGLKDPELNIGLNDIEHSQERRPTPNLSCIMLSEVVVKKGKGKPRVI